MKISKLFLVTTFATLAVAQFASAQVAIYISGAPATRKIWNQSLATTLASLTTASSQNPANIVETWTTTSSGTTYAGANQTILSGGYISGTAVTIYTEWGGSTEGNQAVAASTGTTNTAFEEPYINSSYAGTSGTVSTSSTTGNLQYPNINLSDTYQKTTPFNGTSYATSPVTSYNTLHEPTPNNPAVTGFEFLANKGAPSGLTNLTSDQAQVLYTNGSLPLAVLTGSTANQSTIVYAIGRDIGSGARYILLAESGIGAANSDNLTQYAPALAGSGTAAVITDIVDNLTASGTINEIAFAQGNGGYSSTSLEQSTLEASSSTSAVGYVIGYLTDTDAATVTGTTGNPSLTWNGVPYSVNNIENGSYTYWSYLHVYYNSNFNTSTSLVGRLAQAIDNDLSTDTTDGAILSSNLDVTRTNNGDGGTVSTKYY